MVEDEARESPVRFLDCLPPLEDVTEALRSHSRRSQKVLELYSSSILKLVNRLLSLTSTSSEPHVAWVAGAGGYPLGTSPRNVCRNGWETVVL